MKITVKYPRFRFLGMATLVMIFLAVSCNREEAEIVTQPNADALEEYANEQYLKAEIVGGDEQSPFYVYNDGLIDEYTASDANLNARSMEAPNKLVNCLLNVNLTEEQRANVRRALVSYQKRNQQLIQQHREAVAELNQAMQQRRLYLMRLFRSGEIDRAEFHKRMSDLREKYTQTLKNIKQEHAFNFRRSYRFMLNNLLEILDDAQWNRFVTCMNARI